MKKRNRKRRRAVRRGLLVVLFWVAVVAGTMGLYAAARDYALAERGYQAIGGEVFVLFLPVIVYAVGRTVADWISALAEFRRPRRRGVETRSIKARRNYENRLD